MMNGALELQRMAADATNLGTLVVDKELASSRARVEKARAFIAELPEGSSILDVGCADGGILAPFVGRYTIHGLDASEELVAIACGHGILAKVGDVQTMPFPDASFDAVFAGEVIEHTMFPDLFLSEINRILKPSGVLVLTAPNIRTPVGIAMMLFGMAPMYAARYRSEHLRDFTASLLKTAVANNGFTIEKFTGSAFMIPKIGPRFPKLGGLFASWADNLIVKARKAKNVVYDASCEFGALERSR